MPIPICQGQTFVDGLSGEKFQLHAGLLAICKVCLSRLDVQWKGWLFENLAQEHEHTKLIAEERRIR